MSTIAKRVKEVNREGTRIFVSPRKTKDVLTIEGSVLGGPSHLALGRRSVAVLTAELLDAGTVSKSKEVLRKMLADKGISLSFSSSGARTYFSASALPEDLTTVLALIAECLTKPRFDEQELLLAKERMLGELDEERTNTRTQAAIALSRALYEPSHPNYSATLEETAQSLKKITRAELVAHQKGFSRNGLVVAIVGDVVSDSAVKAATAAFGVLPPLGAVNVTGEHAVVKNPRKEALVTIPDKANVDTFFGRTLDMTYDSPSFFPLSLAVSLLGGRGLSTGHLMRTIRERDGLTYGIYGSMNGFEDGTTGFWRIWGTFAPSVFASAIPKVKKEIEIFLKSGITEKTLALKKQEVAGSYQVALSTSQGLASALHKLGKEGKPLSYIDAYPELIRSIPLSEVKKAAALLAPSELVLAAAGTFVSH